MTTARSFAQSTKKDDLGVDGFSSSECGSRSGRLIDVQIKTGDSYISRFTDEFVVDVDARHLDYWLNFMVPVIIVCYTPSKNLAVWVSVRDYI